MHITNLSRIHGKIHEVIAPTKQFAIIELVQDLVTSKMQNTFDKDTFIFFKLSCPQGNVTADIVTSNVAYIF